ncbi:reverse transcriptase [Gossypium australe]|uniref:Reverse transcriptase n=1 Tax=Gossypium australe TaxID=47621 RepID=A0A5B6WN34_9ROSI|nr:reverse transcriptase [Gossypium australe]
MMHGCRGLEMEGFKNEIPATFFTKLWGLKVPSKIQIHMWRIANDYIPTLHNRRVCKLVENTLCPVCQEDEETVLRGLGVTNPTCNRESNWKKWLEMEFNNLNIEACKVRIIVYWVIWYNRNKIYHEGVREQVNEVVGFVNVYCVEIAFMRDISKKAQAANSSEWKPSENDTIKINFDASFNQHMGRSCSRIIVQNKEDLVMAACTFPWENISDPVMAEARACLQAIIMAKEMGFQEFCVEGDALTTIRKLNSTEEDKFGNSSLIKEIKGKIPNFRRLSFKYIPREANKATHRMAIEGGRHKNPQHWI